MKGLDRVKTKLTGKTLKDFETDMKNLDSVIKDINKKYTKGVKYKASVLNDKELKKLQDLSTKVDMKDVSVSFLNSVTGIAKTKCKKFKTGIDKQELSLELKSYFAHDYK